MKTSSKKIILGVLAVGFVAALSIGGTLAFMTDSEQVKNHFSVGDLDITIDEPSWDDSTDGEDLIPGDSRDKDPTITAVKGDSYMRVIMMIQNTDGTLITDQNRLDLILTTIRYAENNALVEGKQYSLDEISAYPTVNPKFTLDKDYSEPGIYFYNYQPSVTEEEETDIFTEGTEVLLFTDIIIPKEWDISPEMELLGGGKDGDGKYQIVLQAQAIRAETFDNAQEAFDALDNQLSDDSELPVVQNYGEVDADSDLEFALAGRTVTS